MGPVVTTGCSLSYWIFFLKNSITMAKTAFLETKLIFQSYKDLYIVSTDADYIYIENDKNDAEYFFIKISIDDWEEIIAFTSKMLKNG